MLIAENAGGGLVLWLAVFTTGCGGPAYNGVKYDDGRVRYSLESPPSPWRSVTVDNAHDLAWNHPSDAAVLHASGSCDPRLDIPLQSLTNHLFAGFRNREIVSQVRRPILEREALDTHVRASLDGVLRELRIVVLKKDECVYDFSVVAPPDARFERSNAFFERWITGFSVP